MARSSSGLGHRPLKAEIEGSNPLRATTDSQVRGLFLWPVSRGGRDLYPWWQRGGRSFGRLRVAKGQSCHPLRRLYGTSRSLRSLSSLPCIEVLSGNSPKIGDLVEFGDYLGDDRLASVVSVGVEYDFRRLTDI